MLNIIAIAASFVVGYLFFWGIVMFLKKPLGVVRPFIGHKYLGFPSYANLRSYVLGAQALWAPIIGVGSIALISSLGWSESFWILTFLAGYACAFLRFWRKPKSAWDAEDLPVWHA